MLHLPPPKFVHTPQFQIPRNNPGTMRHLSAEPDHPAWRPYTFTVTVYSEIHFYCGSLFRRTLLLWLVVQRYQCCSCHATQQDGVLPGRLNRQQSPAGPVNTKRNMRRLYPIVGASKVNFGWKLGPFITAPVNHSPARNTETTTTLPNAMKKLVQTTNYKIYCNKPWYLVSVNGAKVFNSFSIFLSFSSSFSSWQSITEHDYFQMYM